MIETPVVMAPPNSHTIHSHIFQGLLVLTTNCPLFNHVLDSIIGCFIKCASSDLTGFTNSLAPQTLTYFLPVIGFTQVRIAYTNANRLHYGSGDAQDPGDLNSGRGSSRAFRPIGVVIQEIHAYADKPYWIIHMLEQFVNLTIKLLRLYRRHASYAWRKL
jgi:hypothetical protein